MNGCLLMLGALLLMWLIITGIYTWLGGWGLFAFLLVWFLLTALDG